MPDVVDTPLIDLSKGSFSDGPDVAPNRKTTRTATPPKKRPPLPPWKDGVISAWATNLYITAGRMVEPFDAAYGAVLQGIAVPAGEAWENLAKDSPQLRRILHSLMTTTKLSELVMAHTPLIILVLHRHGPVREQMDTMAEKLAEQMSTQNGQVVGD